MFCTGAKFSFVGIPSSAFADHKSFRLHWCIVGPRHNAQLIQWALRGRWELQGGGGGWAQDSSFSF